MFTTPQAASPTPPLLAFFAEGVCDAGASPPRTATSSPPNGGNCTIRGATRRRHAVARLLMLQNPPPLPEQSEVAAPMSARARPRRPLTRSLGSHTQARDAEFAGTRHTPPTKTPTFPHQQAEKSPLQQHVVSYNPASAGTRHTPPTKTPTFPHQQAKSRHKTNTFCPLTPPLRLGATGWGIKNRPGHCAHGR